MNSSTEAVLTALQDSVPEKAYGWDIMRAAAVGSATIYPILRRIEEAGWVEGAWDDSAALGRPRRRYYRLTPLGEQVIRSRLQGRMRKPRARVKPAMPRFS
jgi:DNA-binding PadR family transcriptional regulator